MIFLLPQITFLIFIIHNRPKCKPRSSKTLPRRWWTTSPTTWRTSAIGKLWCVIIQIILHITLSQRKTIATRRRAVTSERYIGGLLDDATTRPVHRKTIQLVSLWLNNLGKRWSGEKGESRHLRDDDRTRWFHTTNGARAITLHLRWCVDSLQISFVFVW